MKIGCLIYARGTFHERLAHCALRSFKKWHPTIPVIGVKTDHVTPDIEMSELDEEMLMVIGIRKYALASRAMKENNLDKIIILGSDTITCGVLDEFIDNNSADILATLDYPYPISTAVFNGQGYEHLNADVVCFNSTEAIDSIVERSPAHGHWCEQGGLNEVYYTSGFKCETVDSPYNESNVAYNVRSKGNTVASPMTQWEYTNKFIVRDSKLLIPTPTLQTRLKHLKVWHYCEGFGCLDYTSQKERMDYWFTKGFNEETKKFFKEECDCGDFFDGEFTL